jgi:hypothetical protein
LVRHGHLPEREIMTGIGPVAVRCPRVRDRGGEGSERIRFSSAILPPYVRGAALSMARSRPLKDRSRFRPTCPVNERAVWMAALRERRFVPHIATG